MKGIIIENSLSDTSILKEIEVVRSWQDGDWKLHEVRVTEDQAKNFSKFLNDGPWYIHFWETGKDDVLVVFKDEFFNIKHSNKSTWISAVEYGISIGIPKEQLNFPIR